MKQSKKLFEEAEKYIPGGVNSPVRAFKSVGGTPLFIKKAKGAYLIDQDNKKYIDMIGSWGPMIMGHTFKPVENQVRKAIRSSLSFGTPTHKEVEMAKLICQIVPSVEMVRMVNSGTEATMSAIRLARAYTSKSKIIKFEGNYHGHGDSFLISAGSGALTIGQPDSSGVTSAVAADTLTVPYNDIPTLEKVIKSNKNQIAGLIIEPVAGNMGCVLPHQGYLQSVRDICTRESIILIFDEVMTGFRLSLGGAQERYGVMPDLTTMGKIIGGGMPVGAYGGKKEIMTLVAPSGSMYQAGTLSGNPITMTAGLSLLRYLKGNTYIYEKLEESGQFLAQGLQLSLKEHGLNYQINQVGSMYSLFFTDQGVTDLTTAKTSDTVKFSLYFHAMLKSGIYLAPSQFESLFLSAALEKKHLKKIIKATHEILRKIQE